jgi:hypothetical protein
LENEGSDAGAALGEGDEADGDDGGGLEIGEGLAGAAAVEGDEVGGELVGDFGGDIIFAGGAEAGGDAVDAGVGVEEAFEDVDGFLEGGEEGGGGIEVAARTSGSDGENIVNRNQSVTDEDDRLRIAQTALLELSRMPAFG